MYTHFIESEVIIMSSTEITRDVIVALIGSNFTYMGADTESAKIVAECYEIIFNKIDSLNK